jgi:hypothetical protein
MSRRDVGVSVKKLWRQGKLNDAKIEANLVGVLKWVTIVGNSPTDRTLGSQRLPNRANGLTSPIGFPLFLGQEDTAIEATVVVNAKHNHHGVM